MRLYLDENISDPALGGIPRNSGHEVASPLDWNLREESDAVQLAGSVRRSWVLLTHDYHDFRELHELILAAGGHHPGVFVIRKDNDPTRDMSHRGIARAIGRFLESSAQIADSLVILNHWR